MLNLSNYAENKVIDFVLRNQAFASPTTVYLAMFTAFAEGGTQTEVGSGNGYARQAVSFTTAADGQIENDAAIDFPEPTAGWGTVTHVAIMDASSGGNVLAWAALSSSVTINSGKEFSFSSGELTVSLGGDYSDHLADELLDHIFNAAAYTPPATVYCGLLSAYTDDDTFTELSGNGYARKDFTFDAAADGATANTSDEQFATATGDWTTATHWAIFDASSAGNLLFRQALDSNATVLTDETFRIKSGQLQIDVT